MEIWIEAFIEDFGHFLQGSILNIIHELLQAALGGGAEDGEGCQ